MTAVSRRLVNHDPTGLQQLSQVLGPDDLDRLLG
jgi:hypothetical protein